jgi:hypothetical protein
MSRVTEKGHMPESLFSCSHIFPSMQLHRKLGLQQSLAAFCVHAWACGSLHLSTVWMGRFGSVLRVAFVFRGMRRNQLGFALRYIPQSSFCWALHWRMMVPIFLLASWECLWVIEVYTNQVNISSSYYSCIPPPHNAWGQTGEGGEKRQAEQTWLDPTLIP